ncbi:MAG: glycosyltransferase family 39 protein, partial [candidate division Zixibacteria bacterium]|nr:glycosyltransferase family 39 protein [candidate division Zixibacteria bacterium]
MKVKDAAFRQWIYFVLILAAILRLGFLASDKTLPVMWDARRYASAAVAVISFVDGTGPESSTDDRLDRHAFKFYYDKYIQGEKIDWQYYTPHSLTQARGDLFFAGPLYPAMLAAVFYLAPAADFTFARILGIIFDLLSVWLVILVAARLVGRRAAIVSGLVYAIYFPFIQTATMLLLETSTSFFILLAVYLLMRGTESNQRRYFVLTGLLCGMMVMHKPTSMLIGLPLVAGLYFYDRENSSPRQFLKRLVTVAIPAGCLFGPWLVITSLEYGQLALRDPAYAQSNLRQSSSIAFEGYDLDAVEKDFNSRPIYSDPLGQAGGYMGLFAKKFERLWSRPYNDFKRTFVIPNSVVEWLHTLIIVFGFIGMLALLLKSSPHAAWPVAICGYYTAIHLVFHSINRYSFNALPVVIICAAGCSVALYDALVSSPTRSRLMV